MKEIECVNYYHYGDQLERWLKDAISYASGVLKVTESSYSFDPKSFQIFSNSILLRERFKRLKVRGFSHRFCLDVGDFGLLFERSVNLRAALLFDPALFYPKKVRFAMWRVVNFHCRPGGLRPIAFALGRRIGNRWFVLQVQSDLAFRGGQRLGITSGAGRAYC